MTSSHSSTHLNSYRCTPFSLVAGFAQSRINANNRLVNQYTSERLIVGITVGTRMSFNTHRRYQKTHQNELNHERGCMFAPILSPTPPSTGYNSSRKLWLLAAGPLQQRRPKLAQQVHPSLSGFAQSLRDFAHPSPPAAGRCRTQ